MSYIYCITNHVNGKKYIGKTTSSVSKRWKEHCRDYKKERCKDRPLYRAMNKYGIDSFSIEMLEECSSKESSGRETYWINEFKTYGNGYNATTGGDGSIIWNYDEIRELSATIWFINYFYLRRRQHTPPIVISISIVFCGWASSSVGLEYYSDKVGVIGSSPILPTS